MTDDEHGTHEAPTEERGHPHALYQPHRSIFLTDGVVAIAVTLLALDLKPDLPHGLSSGQLAHYLHEHGTQYSSFLFAFWLIARFWMLHHGVLRDVVHLDTASVWTNLVFLFAITCMPLTTYVNGAYSSSLATTLFAGNLLLASLALAVLGDLVRRRGLTSAPDSPVKRVVRRWQMITSAAVPAVVMGMAWVVTRAEPFFLLLLLADVPGRLAARRTLARMQRAPA